MPLTCGIYTPSGASHDPACASDGRHPKNIRDVHLKVEPSKLPRTLTNLGPSHHDLIILSSHTPKCHCEASPKLRPLSAIRDWAHPTQRYFLDARGEEMDGRCRGGGRATMGIKRIRKCRSICSCLRV